MNNIRDVKFEVQFLLSLSLVVLGVTTSSKLSDFIDTRVAGVYLLLASTHLVLLNVSYLYRRSTQFGSPQSERAYNISDWTLVLSTMGFGYLFFHIVLTSITIGQTFGQVRQISLRNLIIYVGPIVPVMTLGVPFISRITDSIRFSNSTSIRVVPDSIRVYPEFDETTPVMIEIENAGDREYNFDIEISFGDRISVKKDGKLYNKNIGVETTIRPGRRRTWDLNIRHDSKSRKTDIIEVEVLNENGNFSDEVVCDLRA